MGAQTLEAITLVLLLLGFGERLGPSANPTVCTAALVAWGIHFLDKSSGSMPPIEDLDEAGVPENDKFMRSLGAAALLGMPAIVLLPGHLVPYGFLSLPEI